MAQKGRPKKPNAFSEYYGVRFTQEQKQLISAVGTADQWRTWMLDLAKAKIETSDPKTLPYWNPTEKPKPDEPAKDGNT